MKTAIYGIGNILMGDDGIGPAVVRYLSSNYTLPPDTTLEDLGTPSLDLPAYLAGYDRVIVIDAVALDAPPGTVHVFSRDEITSVPTGIRVSPHEPTINDALIVLDFAGHRTTRSRAGGCGAGDAGGRDGAVAAGGGGGGAAANVVLAQLSHARLMVSSAHPAAHALG
ncbi:MAG TPA: hydrogenase maturation protease [Thermoanaerobaculia bacterium]